MRHAEPSNPQDHLKVLCIEADALEAEALLRQLAQGLPTGCVCVSAASLREALVHFTAGGDIDAVLLNPELPDSQGFATLESLREPARHVAVIVLTDRDDESMAQKAIECGAQEYLLKGEVGGRALGRMVRHAVGRKRAELALRRSGQQDREMAAAIEHVTTGVIIVDPQLPGWPIIFSNPAFGAITGYAHEEIVGRNCRFLQGPQTDRSVVAQIRAVLLQGQSFRGELLNYRKDGTPFWNELTISPVFDEAGQLTRYVGITNDITAHKAAEQARFESEARFHTLTDVVPQVIWTNEAGGKANYFNRRWFEYSGLDFAGSVGLGWQAIVHSEDAPASKERWYHALAAGEIFDTEYRLRRADGMYRWHLGRNVPLKDNAGHVLGWFGTATDIHDLKETEAAFAATQECLRLIVESADEHAIVSLDRERRVTSWSPGAAVLTGYPAEEMIGQPMDLTFLPEDRAAGLPEHEASEALAVGRAHCDRWRLRKDGSLFWATCALLPMRARPGGEVIGFVNILSDQTKIQQARAQLEQSHAELQTALQETERARAAAEAANRAKDHFLAVLSHELRTPLTPVLMATNMLQQRHDLPPPVEKALAMIHRNVELEVHFIDEMLDLTRLSQGKMELLCAPMDLHEAIRRAVEVSESDMQEKGQRLEVSLEAPRHMLQGDSARLQQVFWNLLKNAAKFTPAGGEIHLRTRSAGTEGIEVEVTDTGIGMAADTLGKVFQPFEQADPSIAQQFGGLGLGLAIAKASVSAHGGTIRAASAGQGQGATFTVSLPAERFQ